MVFFRGMRLSLLFGCLSAISIMIGCGGGDDKVPVASIEKSQSSSQNEAKPADSTDVEPVQLTASKQDAQSPARPRAEDAVRVRIKTSVGDIVVQLNAEKSPRTVENFLYNYVERGFFDGTIVHYVEPGYMIAAGGYDQNFESKETRTPILCEADNGLKNVTGTVAMARNPDYANSATSQFFINLTDSPSLDYQQQDDRALNGYCVFGEVIEGFDVAERIAAVKVHDRDDFPNTPVEPVVIESIAREKKK